MSDDGTERQPWEKARDEALDEMAGQRYYEWEDIQVAVDEVVRRWRQVHAEADQVTEDGNGSPYAFSGDGGGIHTPVTGDDGAMEDAQYEYIEIDLYHPFDAAEPAERLALAPNEPFDATLIGDEWRIEVVGVVEADSDG